MWYSNDMFRYILKAEFCYTLGSLKVPSGKVANFGHQACQVVGFFFFFLVIALVIDILVLVEEVYPTRHPLSHSCCKGEETELTSMAVITGFRSSGYVVA